MPNADSAVGLTAYSKGRARFPAGQAEAGRADSSPTPPARLDPSTMVPTRSILTKQHVPAS